MNLKEIVLLGLFTLIKVVYHTIQVYYIKP